MLYLMRWNLLVKLKLRRVIDMTIDEAIALVKIERECVIRADACDRKCEKCDLLQDSTELTDMYEQLAEWLEDYKRIKMLIAIEQALKAEYNKAIDDFIKAVDKHCGYYAGECQNLTRDDLLGIANNMKLKSDG